jgi:hypothetical protein
MKKRAVAFGDIRQHPFDRDVGDRVRRRRVSRLHQKSRLRVHDVIWPDTGTGHDQGGINLARGDDLIDFSVGLAEDADSIPRGFESALRRLFIGGRLLQLPFGNSRWLCKDPWRAPVPCWSVRKLPRRRSGRLGLDEVGAVNRIERLSLLNFVAEFHEGLDDLSLIGGKTWTDRSSSKLDVADRLLLNGKQVVPTGSILIAFSWLGDRSTVASDGDVFGICTLILAAYSRL